MGARSMIRQSLYDTARARLSAGAGTNNAPKLILQGCQLRNAGLNLDQMTARDTIGLCARTIWIVCEIEQRPYIGEFEP